jgi:hypothetical protein
VARGGCCKSSNGSRRRRRSRSDSVGRPRDRRGRFARPVMALAARGLLYWEADLPPTRTEALPHSLHRTAQPMLPRTSRPRPGAVPCRHCGRLTPVAPRGLCRPCYLAPHVRSLYPPARAGRDPALGGLAPMPTEPTTALPGTPAKVAVLCRRAAQGEALWHPEDAALPVAGGGWHRRWRGMAAAVSGLRASGA